MEKSTDKITSFLNFENGKNIPPENYHKLSIAPMLDISNRYFRVFLRMISKHITFYTEMINCDVIVRHPD